MCTIGPASRSPETLEQLIRAGMDVAASVPVGRPGMTNLIKVETL